MLKQHKITLAAIMITGLAACSTADKQEADTVSLEQISNQQWQLVKVDEQTVTAMGEKFPSIMIQDDLKVNGVAGCNNFFGQAEFEEGNIRIEQMGMTMMMCPPPLDKIEQQVSATFAKWSPVTVSGNTMTVTGEDHTLTYQLK
ncbi:META domain-containing protein [Motilimonas pumila]|uniref:META domain-containing protein n=1 Tax=Motilimonas pumila TaxID=2303987 RepID=A0A418YCW6_9GAMM|nr:META domain-containing protein [Motilimonas pumila]RJG42367.1 META domain-containing protein [Motilimonas pumila]